MGINAFLILMVCISVMASIALIVVIAREGLFWIGMRQLEKSVDAAKELRPWSTEVDNLPALGMYLLMTLRSPSLRRIAIGHNVAATLSTVAWGVLVLETACPGLERDLRAAKRKRLADWYARELADGATWLPLRARVTARRFAYDPEGNLPDVRTWLASLGAEDLSERAS